MKTAEIMTRDPITIAPEASVREAIGLMLAHRVSGLPVVDAAGALVGILTEGDLMRRGETGTERQRRPWLEFLLGPGRLAQDYVKTHGRRVAEIMTRDVAAVGPDTPVDEVVALMERRRIKRLPVLEGGVLEGIVSRADLMAALARILDREAELPAGDDAIRERVQAELHAVGWAPRSGVTVTVTNGIVELNGAIFEEKERAALRVAAENVPGVRGVEDRLVWVEPVSGTVLEPPPPEPAPRPGPPPAGGEREGPASAGG
jgi:CBS domain-containing protein